MWSYGRGHPRMVSAERIRREHLSESRIKEAETSWRGLQAKMAAAEPERNI
jgi:hypothetical protein